MDTREETFKLVALAIGMCLRKLRDPAHERQGADIGEHTGDNMFRVWTFLTTLPEFATLDRDFTDCVYMNVPEPKPHGFDVVAGVQRILDWKKDKTEKISEKYMGF